MTVTVVCPGCGDEVRIEETAKRFYCPEVDRYIESVNPQENEDDDGVVLGG